MRLSTNEMAGLRFVAPLSSVSKKLTAEPHGRNAIVSGLRGWRLHRFGSLVRTLYVAFYLSDGAIGHLGSPPTPRHFLRSRTALALPMGVGGDNPVRALRYHPDLQVWISFVDSYQVECGYEFLVSI